MTNNKSLYTNLFEEEKSDILKELLHSCINEICGQPGPSCNKFASQMNWNMKEYESIYNLISAIFHNPASLYLVESKMPQEYYDFPEHVQLIIFNCLKIRREHLTQALIRYYSKKENQTIIDFDWRMKLVMGSSKMASLRECLLQLDLIVENKEIRDIVELELNKDELDILISTVELIAK